MAYQSKCPAQGCGETTFEYASETPRSGDVGGPGLRPVTMVRCTRCGTVVGVLDEVMAKQVGALADALLPRR